MRKNSLITGIAVGLLALVPLTATADKVATVETSKPATAQATELDLDTIVSRHVTALGGEKLLRAGKSLSVTVSGEKNGKAFTKTVTYARPNLMRVELQAEDGPISKGFDGKVAWVKKGTAAAEQLSAEDTAMMKSKASFEEPLLDYAKKGTKVKLVGKTEVDSKPAYDLEVTLASGETEHHFLDASSYLVVKQTWSGKDKAGKVSQMSYRFADYKKVQGRMVNHSVVYEGDDGKAHKAVVSNVSYDKAVPAKLFAMPK